MNRHQIKIPLLLLLFSLLTNSYAQSLEPRAYSNAPVGLNFLIAGYQNSQGALVFDPTIPVTDASADVDIGFLGYVHTFDIAGKLSKLGIILPYATLDASGIVDGTFRSREISGLADPSFYFSINFYGSPALNTHEFRQYHQDTIIGITFKVTAPAGEYESDKVINIGTNRWSLSPGFGVSKMIDRWTLEASANAIFYTENNQFDGDKTRRQDPVYAAQLHLTYTIPRNIWVAASATYFAGGRTTVDGKLNNDLQQNWRVGLTLAIPVDRSNSIKLYTSSGVSARTGTNFDTLGIAWQYRWSN